MNLRGIRDEQHRLLVRDLVARGWTIEPRTSKRTRHLKIVHPNGGCVFVSMSPSDWRGIKNLRAQVRRIEARHQTS